MSNPDHRTPRTAARAQPSKGWQLLVALAVASALVVLKQMDGTSAFGALGHWSGLAGVLTALVATCFLIQWIGAAAPALLFITVFLVAAGYVPLREATGCLKEQLADPFVMIVFSGFTLLTLIFGMPSERGTPPAWALRPGELVGRDGEWLRSRMGRLCLRRLSEPLWARLGALLPGFVITLISSGLGADAMARMAAIPKHSTEDAGSTAKTPLRADEQSAHAAVFVLVACVLAPALIPVSLWGMFFRMQAGNGFDQAGASPWLTASYPCLMAILLPGWLSRSTGTRRHTVLAYYGMYALAWAAIVALAFLLRPFSREQFALGLLILTVLYASFRVIRRCMEATQTLSLKNQNAGLQPLSWWASKVEWELVKGGFSRALSVVVIVVFAAVFRKVIEKSVPLSVDLPWVTQFPLTAFVSWALAVFVIGISIGTAFGTFVLGLALFRILWPVGLPFDGQAPILFWLLVSVSAAVNQISPQADNVEVLEKYMNRERLTTQVSRVILPTLALSMLFSCAGWIYCSRNSLSWIDLTASVGLACGGALVFFRGKKILRAGEQRKATQRLLWLGVLGESAKELVGESRIAGEFVASYDADNDISNVKPENAAALIRTVPLEGDGAWALADDRTKPDALLVLVGQETRPADLLGSPLIARALREGHPHVRVVRVLQQDRGEQPEASAFLARIGGGAIKNCLGRIGLRALSRELVACVDYREGNEAKPRMYDWLFVPDRRAVELSEVELAGAAKDVGPGARHGAAASVPPRVSTERQPWA